jgi:hypothetical protein
MNKYNFFDDIWLVGALSMTVLAGFIAIIFVVLALQFFFG